MKKTIKACAAMACLTALEITALLKDVDGALFVPIVAAIAALGGYTVARKEK